MTTANPSVVSAGAPQPVPRQDRPFCRRHSVPVAPPPRRYESQFRGSLTRASRINRNRCGAQPHLSESVGSFIDRRAKAAERRPKDYGGMAGAHRRGHVRS
jgi:hypothetical protein